MVIALKVDFVVVAVVLCCCCYCFFIYSSVVVVCFIVLYCLIKIGDHYIFCFDLILFQNSNSFVVVVAAFSFFLFSTDNWKFAQAKIHCFRKMIVSEHVLYKYPAAGNMISFSCTWAASKINLFLSRTMRQYFSGWTAGKEHKRSRKRRNSKNEYWCAVISP